MQLLDIEPVSVPSNSVNEDEDRDSNEGLGATQYGSFGLDYDVDDFTFGNFSDDEEEASESRIPQDADLSRTGNFDVIEAQRILHTRFMMEVEEAKKMPKGMVYYL